MRRFFDENPLLIAVRRKIVSTLAKDRLTQMGIDRLDTVTRSSSSRGSRPRGEDRLQSDLSLGMSILLTGGMHKFQDLIIDEIENLALVI